MSVARKRARGLWIVALGIVLAACGGEEEEQAAATLIENHPPTISGTPITTVTPGTAYTFQPLASDPDNDPLIFGIDAKPGWATFDPTTGRLQGTPGSSNAGAHRGIVIWVSDGKDETLLPAFDLTVTSPQPSPNQAPVIMGTPPPSTVVGTAYTFLPTATDGDGDALTFSIRNRPRWATFNTTTGRLQGTPQTADVGTFEDVTISVSDGKVATALAPFDIVVVPPAVNSPPVISGTPMTAVEAGTPYVFVPTASDADGDSLTFGVSGLPSWASFSNSTGRLQGTPPTGTTGTFGGIVISVSDGQATSLLPAFSITVTAPTTNSPPTISGTPATTATQGTQYVFQPAAADPDDDTLTFSIANRPSWATFNLNTGRLQGTPGASHVRTYNNIVISVSDGVAVTALPAFSITVASSNTPPTISGTPPGTATVGTQYSFTPTANDANGGTLTFSITNRPSWATFSTSTGRLSGTPALSHVGTYSNITIRVSDGQDSAQLTPFSIVVSEPPNRAPTIGGTPPSSVVSGQQYTFTPTATDPDDDTLTFSVANAPSWATLNPTTGALHGTPGAADVGTTNGIVITVSDGELTASLPAFSITVQPLATGSATLSWTPPTQNSDGSPLSDLAGYKIYWGPTQGNYPNSVTLNNPGLTSYVVEPLAPGTYYFTATALNSAGVESEFSNTASKTIN